MSTKLTLFPPYEAGSAKVAALVDAARQQVFQCVNTALSRTLTRALIAVYQTSFPEKQLLQTRLHKLYMPNASRGKRT